MSAFAIRVGDCREVLRSLPEESVHVVVTSPPYWGLRDYNVAGQIGLEESPDAFVAAMAEERLRGATQLALFAGGAT